MLLLPEAPIESIIYDNDFLYVCLALFPLTKGHTVVVWKKKAPDLEILDVARDALLQVFKVEKVYLMYMDEVKQVHWHLVPRYNENGFNVFTHEPKKINDFSQKSSLQEAFMERLQSRNINIPD